MLPLEPELQGLQQTSKLRMLRLVLYYHHIDMANKKISNYLSPPKVASVWKQGNVVLTLERKPSSQTSQTFSKMTKPETNDSKNRSGYQIIFVSILSVYTSLYSHMKPEMMSLRSCLRSCTVFHFFSPKT